MVYVFCLVFGGYLVNTYRDMVLMFHLLIRDVISGQKEFYLYNTIATVS